MEAKTGTTLVPVTKSYMGLKGTRLKVWKANDFYYLDQNPHSHSIFAVGARMNHDIKWELSEFPEDYKNLKYTGRVLVDGKLVTRPEARKIINQSVMSYVNKYNAERWGNRQLI